jgi:hypothetical protein
VPVATVIGVVQPRHDVRHPDDLVVAARAAVRAVARPHGADRPALLDPLASGSPYRFL